MGIRLRSVQTKKIDLDVISRSAVKELLPTLTDQLRTLAKTSQWPGRVINNLSVESTDDFTLYVDYPEEMSTEVEDLEYGSPGQIPNAVIRPFILRSEPTIAKVLEKKTVTDLFTGMGIM